MIKINKKVNFAVMFILFLIIYIMLDRVATHGGYRKMAEQIGLFYTIAHIILDISISFVSALIGDMVEPVKISLKDKPASSVPMLGILFGIFTFGCAPCVIGFLAVIGISFVPPALFGGNIILKLLTLIIVIIGYFINKQIVKRATCKIK